MNVPQQPFLPDAPGSPLSAHGRAEGRIAFRDQFVKAIEQAAQSGWRHAVFCDPNFTDWPLGERATEAALDAWAQTGARFTVLAQDYGEVTRRHPRFVCWRVRWSHLVECWQPVPATAPALPSVLWTQHWMLHRLDAVRSVFIIGGDSARRRALRELLDQWLRTARPAFPATALGL